MAAMNHGAIFPLVARSSTTVAPAPRSQACELDISLPLASGQRSADLGGCRHAAESRHRTGLLDQTPWDRWSRDLRSILTSAMPHSNLAKRSQMATPAVSVATAADLLEDAVRLGRVGG